MSKISTISINTNSSSLKQTKANIKWMNVNNKKVNILLDNGLNMDEIKVVARYIGSCSHDKKYVCPYCGDIYSLKMNKNISRYDCDKDPEVIRRKDEEKMRIRSHTKSI